MNILEKIVRDTKRRINDEFSDYSFSNTFSHQRRSLVNAIKVAKTTKIPIISELKPASPSEGIILEKYEPVEVACAMVRGGCVGISVLTEERYFKGHTENLRKIRQNVTIPVLMKDFIVDERQIYKAAEIGADVVLLIPSICPFEYFINLAESYGMDALIEVHNKDEVKKVMDANIKLIGINNRDLTRMKVNLENTKLLAPLIREYNENTVIVSESGIKSHEDARYVISHGADGVLVGTSIMKSGDISSKIQEIAGGISS
ncbi:MAG: indole-3-glycerol-phosphate synthase [Promethearchaeota archaeon]